MKSGRQGQAIIDPSTKDKSKKVDTEAQGISVKSKAARGLSCRKSGTSVGKVSKRRPKTTVQCLNLQKVKFLSQTGDVAGNDNGYYLHLPATPLHPQSPVITSINTLNTPLEIPSLVRVQSTLQNPKFQLQLFPMDEPTRKRLEEENHCPYLELTITIKKKIASVIRHLNMKWGNSSSALEELFLFPYNARVESLESYKRWTLKDSNITAAEVHAAIGKPAVFRLRYGWLSILEPKTSNSSQTYHNLANQLTSNEVQKKDVVDRGKEPSAGVSQECEPLPAEELPKLDVSETAPMKTSQAEDNLRSDNDVKLQWVDCVSNMSFGALLSEAEADDGAKLCCQAPQKQFSISCDSFDAAIAAHILRYQTGNQSTTVAQPSILDAEETCNPFSFHNFTSSNKNCSVQSQITPITSTTENAQHLGVKLCNVPDLPVEPLNMTLTSEEDEQPIQEEENNQLVGNKKEKEGNQVDANATNSVNNQFEVLDMHWPPSAGSWPFVASSQQITVSSDSNGLSGFASTSLDIF